MPKKLLKRKWKVTLLPWQWKTLLASKASKKFNCTFHLNSNQVAIWHLMQNNLFQTRRLYPSRTAMVNQETRNLSRWRWNHVILKNHAIQIQTDHKKLLVQRMVQHQALFTAWRQLANSSASTSLLQFQPIQKMRTAIQSKTNTVATSRRNWPTWPSQMRSIRLWKWRKLPSRLKMLNLLLSKQRFKPSLIRQNKSWKTLLVNQLLVQLQNK